MAKPKRTRDPNQLAKLLVDIATGGGQDKVVDGAKNPHAVSLGRLGGQRGGKARAAKLTKTQRSAIARRAAQARWKG